LAAAAHTPFVNTAPKPRVLVVHNRYRITGGEERSVDLQLSALTEAGVDYRLFERRSEEAGRARAAAALLSGGRRPGELHGAVRELGANIVHAHNTLPLIGPAGLAAAREAGARVVLHLHNVRIFCATGFGERDGAPCFRCHGRRTFPGVVLNCRRSVPEAVTYATALSMYQPALVGVVDRFLAPSAWAAGQVVRLGLPAEKVEPLLHYLPDSAFAESSRAGEGEYVFVASRLSPEKGIDDVVAACAAIAVPLRVAGDGPERGRLEDLAGRTGAQATFLGRIPPEEVRLQLQGAAMVAMPSHYHEFSPYSALEAMAQGVPVVATAMGGLPELLGDGTTVPRADPVAFRERLRSLWKDPAARAAEGERLIARARERHTQRTHVAGLMDVYRRVLQGVDDRDGS
jgi:glycosyltransferase involved in cell wall biosynthesis